MSKTNNAVDRHAFNISDGTTITTEALGHVMTSQLLATISSITLPSVESESRARAIKDQIDAVYQQTGARPLVLYSTVLSEIRLIILQSKGFCQDIVQVLVAPLQHEMELDPTPIVHRTYGPNPGNLNECDARVTAIDYILAHDDGISLHNLDQAQVILLGVSCCGRIPASLYLATQFSTRAASYPFTADGTDNLAPPTSLKPLWRKLSSLTVEPECRAAIREERRENSRYALLHQRCMEIAEAEAFHRKNQTPWLNSINYSVEEVAAKILDIMELNRCMYQSASALARFFVTMFTTGQGECDIAMHIISRQSCR